LWDHRKLAAVLIFIECPARTEVELRIAHSSSVQPVFCQYPYWWQLSQDVAYSFIINYIFCRIFFAGLVNKTSPNKIEKIEYAIAATKIYFKSELRNAPFMRASPATVKCEKFPMQSGFE
jgi:hypothetical protein